MKSVIGDWLMNAGILGYIRIQELSGRKIDIHDNSINITSHDLEKFTDSYFTAVTMRVAKRMFRTRTNILLTISDKLDNSHYRAIGTKFKELEEKNYRNITPNYNDFSATLNSIIDKLREHKEEVIELCNKELIKYNEIKAQQKENIKKKLDESYSTNIENLSNKNLKFIVNYLRPFYINKGVIGNYSYNGDRKKGFYSKYIETLIKTIENYPNTDGFLCRFCKKNRVKPKKFDDVNEIFAEGMFSTIALSISFKNFYYNMQPDLFICDLCEFFLLCAWMGFTEIPYRFQDKINDTQYIFVNMPSLTLLKDENKKIQDLYAQSEENIQGTIYQEVIQDIFLKEKSVKSKWALKNILFVELKTTFAKNETRPNFRYFHVGEDIAELFTDEYVIRSFNNIFGIVIMKSGLKIYLRRNLVMKILNHDSVFPICYSLINSHLSIDEKNNLRNVFNISLISSLRDVIISKIRNDKTMMDSKMVYRILKEIRDEGSSFRNVMDYDSRKRKSYILLSMIRNGKIENFYDIVIKIYMSLNKPIPESFLGLLNQKDEISFQSRAYSFMSGFLENET